MTVFITHFADSVEIKARAEREGMIGDLTMIVKPGEEALGKSYDEWAKLPAGKHEIDV